MSSANPICLQSKWDNPLAKSRYNFGRFSQSQRPVTVRSSSVVPSKLTPTYLMVSAFGSRPRTRASPGTKCHDLLSRLSQQVVDLSPIVDHHHVPVRPRRHSRKSDYEQLPQIHIEHNILEAERICTNCGEAKARIGENESWLLQFIPA